MLGGEANATCHQGRKQSDGSLVSASRTDIPHATNQGEERFMRGKAALLVICLLCSSCGPTKVEQLQSENEELRDQVSALKEQLEESRTAASDVLEKANDAEAASGELQADLDRLDSENWATVMTDIRGDGDDVGAAHQSLSSSVDDLETATEER